MQDLNPCPFCGEAEEIEVCVNKEETLTYVECGNCGTCGPLYYSTSKDMEKMAKSAWNRRFGKDMK
jgi:Lar family restriction alleviation protein